MKIKSIYIKKFRSIEDSEINFNTPVTVLIGPNGTGKTNLLLALRFLSGCIALSPIRAVQQAGGLDKVFTVRERRSKEMSFLIESEVMRPETGRPIEKLTKDKLGDVKYKFSLQFEETSKVLIVKNEELSFKDIKSDSYKKIFLRKSDTKKTTINTELEIPGREKDRDIGESIDVHELAAVRLFYLLDRARYLFYDEDTEEYKDIRIYFSIIRQVLTELSSINGYNFDPTELRRSSDLLSGEGMNYSGKGFSSLLHRINNKNYMSRSKFTPPKFYGGTSNTFSPRFKELYSEVLPFLLEVEPNENIDTTSVAIQFTEVQQKDTARKFSTYHLSDGSLKFLAIATTLMLQNYSLLYIEEIENYLNPNAIKRLIQLMKDSAENSGKKYLLTSHSETVLNAMSPDDIIISRRSLTGATTYERFRKIDSINEAMSDSGVGLGYLWGRGLLDGF